MTLAERIVEEAESWNGTRWQHQGRLKGAGVDCAGYIAEVAKAVGVDAEIPNDYKPSEDGQIMIRLLNDHMTLVPTQEMAKGDVLAFCDEAVREPDIPRHLAFVAEVTPKTVFIVHASAHGVRRHRIDAAWRRRIHSVWRIRE